MPYHAPEVANSLLEKAFTTATPLNALKLQRLLYVMASEYAKATHQPLLLEEFQPWPYGPVLVSIYSQYAKLEGAPLTTYAKNALGESHKVELASNPTLAEVTERVWKAAAGVKTVALAEALRQEGSGWWHAWQEQAEVITPARLETDTSYRGLLGL